MNIRKTGRILPQYSKLIYAIYYYEVRISWFHELCGRQRDNGEEALIQEMTVFHCSVAI